MKFGPVPVAEAAGAILAHSVAAGAVRLRKGRLLSVEDVEALTAAGLTEIIAAVPAAGDLLEDRAASAIAEALIHAGIDAKPPSTGRVNLHARAAGVFTVDRALVDAVNAVDPSITLATLPEHAPVTAGQMVATVKIIPFAVSSRAVDKVTGIAAGGSAFSVHPYRAAKIGLIQTELPSVKPSVLDKTAQITGTRLARSGSSVSREIRTPHRAGEVAKAIRALLPGNDMVIAFGASAMSDAGDVLPAAIVEAGGEVLRVGMPVDPGNLLVIGRVDGKPVLGAPGCARSPKENGFDWVLDRLAAGLDVASTDVARMGVGGLLMEIPTRPQPREAQGAAKSGRVAAVVLAAGRSTRMGGPNKLLARFGTQPLVRRTVERALASRASRVVVVTGHQADRVRSALAGLDVIIVHNPDFASGLSSSLKAGVAAVPGNADGVLVMLGDMPELTSADLDRLIAAFAASGGQAVARATHGGKRGNPVILPRALFASVLTLEGDTGARHLVEADGQAVVDVEIGAGAEVDVDTPDAMARAGGVLQD